MTPTVDCIDLFGVIHKVSQDKIILRPAAYAIVVRQGKILLLKMKSTGKYHLPGGGIEASERIEETLKRELQEETGIEIEAGRLAHFEEVFFYYNPSGKAYHGLHFYYLCKPKTEEIIEDSRVIDGSAEKPSWVAIEGLRQEDFQLLGGKILELCRQVD